MSWDPFGINNKHKEVREKIANGTRGLAQSDVSGELVSYDVSDGYPGNFYFESSPDGGMKHSQIMEEMILDVASGEGIASDGTFGKTRVSWMIKTRRAYPDYWTKKHAEAARLEALLRGRPALFLDD